MTYQKDVVLPEDVDADLISSLLSRDGVLTVHCQLPEKPGATAVAMAPPARDPVVVDDDGNKMIHLRYDVRHYDPKDVKVVLKGNTLFIHAVKEEHSAEVCVKRELKRDFALPADADKDSLVYKVEDGVLTVRIRLNDKVFKRRLSEEGCAGQKIHLEFDVGDFAPEEVRVLLDGNTLKIGARREEKVEKDAKVLDYSRECVVPAWVDTDSLRSYLTHDGKLTIEIPMEKTVRSELHVKVNQ